MLIDSLQRHIDEDTMSTSQVNAAKILLSKIIPDLKSTSFTDSEGNDIPVSLSLEVNREKSKD